MLQPILLGLNNMTLLITIYFAGRKGALNLTTVGLKQLKEIK